MRIRGREVSEETIVEALKAHCGFEEPEYVFQPGDVAVSTECGMGKRIIVRADAKAIESFDLRGTLASVGQGDFVGCGYKKIGTLEDFINDKNI